MEVGVDKSRNPLSGRLMGSNNGAARVIRVMNFRGEVESRVQGLGMCRREMS